MARLRQPTSKSFKTKTKVEFEKSIKAAVAAGVPVITINSGLDQWQQFGAITHVGQSETLAGKAAGEQLNNAGVKNALCVIQEAGNVGLEQRCAGAKSTFSGTLTNLQVDNTDLAGSEATIESKIQADPTHRRHPVPRWRHVRSGRQGGRRHRRRHHRWARST